MSYRYIGNKSRLISNLMGVITSCADRGATVADLMCGTATVSEALKWEGYRVIASDIMTFAVQHAKVRLLLNEAPTFSGLNGEPYLCVLSELNELGPVEGYFFRELSPEGVPMSRTESRKYFTSANAKKIDAISGQIKAWFEQGQISDVENALLRHDLVLAANRVANIAGTYGHYRSSWNTSSLRPLALQPASFMPGPSTQHIVLQGQAEDVSKRVSADICYLDPPYMKRQYAANYHVLETIARGDEPQAIGVSGLRPWRDQYSFFCSKVRVRDSFNVIFENIDAAVILISYSEDGLLEKSDLLELFAKHGEVSLHEFSYPRFRSNSSDLGHTLKEYMFEVRRSS